MRYEYRPRLRRVQYGLVAGAFETLDPATLRFLADARGRCEKLMIAVSIEPSATFVERKRALEELEFGDDICDADSLATAIIELAPQPCRVARSLEEEIEGHEIDVPVEYYEETVREAALAAD